MAWTESDLAALEAAIASGVKSVSFAGPPARTVTYQDVGAMEKARDVMRREIAAASGTRVTHRHATFSRGFRRGGGTSWRRNE